jgi:ribosomal protein S18 acetylase RimI-like enzyme
VADTTISIRRARSDDAPTLWALNALPHIGATADPSVPLDLPAVPAPTDFPDLVDVTASFVDVGGEFLVADLGGRVVGMAGYRPVDRHRFEVLRVRVHPACRRLAVGRTLMEGLEHRGGAAGFEESYLATADNQPEAIAFYAALGYRELERETRPEWWWTLVHMAKDLT